ncbi:hypothetical protein D3C75_885580 [compost metagenome]
MQHCGAELPTGQLILAINDRQRMTLRSIAVILVTASPKIISSILSASKIGCVDLSPAAQNEMSQIIMVMRFSIVPALGCESE